MTKFLKKVFICGILLSSVSAYCHEGGIFVDLGNKLQDGQLSLDEASVEIKNDLTANTNLTVGTLAEGLVKAVDGTNKEILKADDLIVATTTESNGLFTQVFANSDAMKVVPVGGDSTFHIGNGNNNSYIYSNTVGSDAESTDNYAFINDSGVWKTGEGDPVQVIDLSVQNSPFTLSEDRLSLLFTGTFATKTANGVWKLAKDSSDLNKAALTIDSEATLTMGNKKADPEDSSSNNTDSTTFTVTEFGKVSGSIKLLDDDYDTENPPTQTQWETKAVFEPGSEAESGTAITNGTTDLGKYLVVPNTEGSKLLEAKSTEGALLNLALSGKVDLFSQIIPATADGDTKSATIDLFNKANVSSVFPNITNQSSAQISVDVPYTYNIEGGSAYNSIKDLADNVQSEDKVSLKVASKAKIGGLFADGADIKYTMNSKDTENLSKLVDDTIAYAHYEIPGDGNVTNVYLDVSALKKFDDTFKSDEYFYSGEAGPNKLNVIPLDGDAYVIPYNDKSTADLASDSVEKFDLKASTSKNSDVIKKYIEPNMQNATIKTKNGEELNTQPTEKSYSTELIKVGNSGNKKLLLLNASNNNRTVLLDGSYLNVKSKNGSTIDMSTLTLKNGSNINLYGNNNISKLVMDSTSTLNFKSGGKYILG